MAHRQPTNPKIEAESGASMAGIEQKQGTTIIEALIHAVEKGRSPETKAKRVEAVLADMQIERVGTGVTWLHHPRHYPDTIIGRRRPRPAAEQ
jgi:hypothetical protein